MVRISFCFEKDSVKSITTKNAIETKPEGQICVSVDNCNNIKEKVEKRRLIKGLVLLAFICNLAFSSYLSLMNSTTSFIPKGNLGIIGLTVSSAIEIVTAGILLSFVNNIWGIKKILALNLFLGILFPLSFFHPIWAVFIIASFVKGISMVFLISNIYIYGTMLVYRYHRAVGGNLNVLLVIVTGLNNASVGAGYFWGNILEYVVLDTKIERTNNASRASSCGPFYCGEDLSSTSATTLLPPKEKYYTLIGILTGLSVVASVLALFLEDLPNSSEDPKEQTMAQKFIQTTKQTFLTMKDPRVFLAILVTMFIGAQQTFFITVFTYSYVDCTFGVAHVGGIMLVLGLVQTVASCCSYLLVKTLGRLLVAGIAFAGLNACYATLLKSSLWTGEGGVLNFILLTACYAAADSLAMSTIFSAYGYSKKNVNGSYAIASVWWTTGAFICNATNTFFCVKTKLYILIGVSIVTVVPYFYLEYLIRKDRDDREQGLPQRNSFVRNDG